MYNVILAAGDGRRFESYDLPKLLLKVKNIPLFIRAAESLPKKNNYIFIFKKEHFKDYKEIKINIKKKFRLSKILLIKKRTRGQASTLCKIKK